jgi:hypothetical protein
MFVVTDRASAELQKVLQMENHQASKLVIFFQGFG